MTDTHNHAGDSDAQAMIDVTHLAVDPDTYTARDDAGDVVVYSLPRGAAIKTVDLEHLLPEPRRAHGTARFDDLQSLVPYVKRFDNPGTTTLWVGYDTHKVIAVIDDDSTDAETAGWRQRRAELTLTHTPEWLRWAALDNQLVDQGVLAQHIEQSIPDIYEPDGATLLEVVSEFHASTGSNFRSKVDVTSDTVGFLYDEDQTVTAGKAGSLAVPREFTLALAPFLGEPKQQVTARLRWSTRDHRLRLGFVLDRPEEIIRASLDGVREQLSTAFTGDRVYLGTPAAARTTQ